MKTLALKLFLPCLFLMVLGCGPETALTFAPMAIKESACAACAKVDITVPNALGETQMAKTVNTAIREEIISVLHFDDDLAVADMESAIASFTNGYEDLKERFMEEAMPWEATIAGSVSYEDAQILTIKLDSYLFTGGAHGYGEVRYLNFDKVTASELDNEALFTDMDGFTKLAEKTFRTQEEIPADAPINSTGFMFETEAFHLPESIGYTPMGIELFYAPYEIASYADGPIVVTLPFADCRSYLAFQKKP